MIFFVINHFKKYHYVDKQTLLPFLTWMNLLMNAGEKDRDAMAHSLIFQASHLLTEMGVISSIKDITNIFQGSNVCKTNFIINVISSNALHFSEDEHEEHQKHLEDQARAVFATALYVYIRRNSRDINSLMLLIPHSQKPFKGWG